MNASDTSALVTQSAVESKNCKILYIEDNHQNLILVEQILQAKTQVTFLCAMNPVIGLGLAKTHLPDLILMDLQLPDMDGTTAFKALQTYPETRHIPVVAISAQAMQGDIDKAMSADFNDYITKPIDINAFLSKLEQILNSGLI